MEYRLAGSYQAVIYILHAATAYSAVAPIWTPVSTRSLPTLRLPGSSIETENPAGFVPTPRPGRRGHASADERSHQ